MNKNREYRYNFRNSFENKVRSDGLLESTAVLLSAGVLSYTDGLDLITEEELVKATSSFINKSLTIDHKGGMVSKSNMQIKGLITNAWVEGNALMGNIVVTDKPTIESILNGKIKLSTGYRCELIAESGIYNGMVFDRKQVDIRGNHVSLLIEQSLRSVGSQLVLNSSTEETLDLEAVFRKRTGTKQNTTKSRYTPQEAVEKELNSFDIAREDYLKRRQNR